MRCSIILMISIGLLLSSCAKKDPFGPLDPKRDKWELPSLKDSTGKSYTFASTYDGKLELRVRKPDGSLLLAHVYENVDSHPLIKADIHFKLTAPKKHIDINMATIAASIGSSPIKLLQILSNVNLQSQQVYTKVYPISFYGDLGYNDYEGAVVQWDKGSILVREATQGELMGMEHFLTARGTRLVCYNTDFSPRFIKKINLNTAYYPYNYQEYIPLNNTEYLSFDIAAGVICRAFLSTSTDDPYNWDRPYKWELDLSKVERLPSGYKVKIEDYSLTADQMEVKYSTFDRDGKLVKTITHHWEVLNGMPTDRF